MVTTRSADKRTAMNENVGDLALRSRAAEIESASQITCSPTPSGSVIRRETKITIDIPAYSVKKSDVSESAEDDSSYATAKDILSSARDVDSQFAEAAKAFDSSGVATTKIEIPDSQETAATPKKDTVASNQDLVSSEDGTADLTPVSARTRGTKRKMNVESTPIREIKEDLDLTPKPAVDSVHKRFDSEDPAEISDTVIISTQPVQDSQNTPIEVSDDNHDDDVPEVTSTKRTSAQTSSTRANKRRKATQQERTPTNPTKAPQVSLAPTPTISAHSTESDNTIQAQEGIPITTEQSSPNIPTTSAVNLDPSSEEEEATTPLSTHTAILTNHPSNPDPQNQPPQTQTSPQSQSQSQSQSQLQHSHSHFSPDPQTNPTNPTKSTSSPPNLPITHRSKPLSKSTLNTSLLPPRASRTNTLSSYRSSKTSASTRRQGKSKFSLQYDWASKRRRFVLA